MLLRVFLVFVWRFCRFLEEIRQKEICMVRWNRRRC